MTRGSARWLLPLAMPTACGAAALILTLTSTLLLRGGEVPVFLAHLVVVVLAAGTAYLLDDPAAEATAVVPRTLLNRRLRTLLPGLGVTALALTAVGAVLSSRSPSLPLGLLAWETLGLVGFAVALAATFFRLGEPEPGNLVAALLALAVLGALFGQSALPVDLLVTGRPSRALGAGWWGAATAASAVVLVRSSLARAAMSGG